MRQQVHHRRPFALVHAQHLLDDALQVVRVVTRDSVELAFLDLHRKRKAVLGLERRLQRRSFVDNAPERPDVAFVVVLLFVDLFRRHVVGCPDVRVRVHRLVSEHLRQSEVAQLHVRVFSDKDVCRLDVSVQNRVFFASMTLAQGLQDLWKYFPDKIFVDEVVVFVFSFFYYVWNSLFFSLSILFVYILIL